jgi:hypothetical protein
MFQTAGSSLDSSSLASDAQAKPSVENRDSVPTTSMRTMSEEMSLNMYLQWS